MTLEDRATALEPPQSFHDWARTGRASLWRYVLGNLLILVVWSAGTFLMILPLGIAYPGWQVEGEPQPPAWLNQAATLLTFIPMILGVWLAVRFIHGRPFSTVVTPFRRYNWGLVARGALLWLGVMFVTGIVGSLLQGSTSTGEGSSIKTTFDPAVFFPLLAVTLPLAFLQTTAEELWFRGYLGQTTSYLKRNIWVVSIVSALLFMLPHLANAEVLKYSGTEFAVASVPYLAMGFMLAWVSYTSGTIELAIGVHYLNNVIAFTLVSEQGTLTEGSTIFTDEKPSLLLNVATLVVGCVAFILLNRKVRGRGVPVSAAALESQVSPATPGQPVAGWYPDPSGQRAWRWWDGQAWTEHVG